MYNILFLLSASELGKTGNLKTKIIQHCWIIILPLFMNSDFANSSLLLHSVFFCSLVLSFTDLKSAGFLHFGTESCFS